jgi:adenylate cyclase
MAEGRVDRQLAAIMATDIVGYSRMLGEDESGTLATLHWLESTLLAPLVQSHDGRIVKLMGDGALVAFRSAVDAVTCAMTLQAKLAEEPPVCARQQVQLRIAIHIGDVVVTGDDIFGDGVNVAARLQPLAWPGGICISDFVHRQLDGKLARTFVADGEHQLKNIVRPLRIWQWRAGDGAEDFATPSFPATAASRPSIAVLPFDNLSDPSEQSDQRYFSDGMTSEIVTGLSRFRSLSVVAADSSLAIRDRAAGLSEVGRQLGAHYLLLGSVRRAHERMRISVQLIDAQTGAHLWAERYDRNNADVFAVQDDVARQIVATLVGRIDDALFQETIRKPTSSLAAYDLFLRGEAHLRGYEPDDNRQAAAHFEAATQRDPHFALAFAYLALARAAASGYQRAPPAVLDDALALAEKAVALDPQEARCHRMLALVCLFRRSFERAERHFRRAHQLNVNDANCLVQMGGLLARRGRAREALGWIEEGRRLNPFAPPWYNAVLFIALYLDKRYADAALALEELPNPGPFIRARLAAAHAQAGDSAAAAAEVAALLKADPDFSIEDFMQQGVVLERSEDRQHLRDGLLRAGLPSRPPAPPFSPDATAPKSDGDAAARPS